MTGALERVRAWFPEASEETLEAAASLWGKAGGIAPDLDDDSRYALMVNLAEEEQVCGNAQAALLWREILRRRGREVASRG